MRFLVFPLAAIVGPILTFVIAGVLIIPFGLLFFLYFRFGNRNVAPQPAN